MFEILFITLSILGSHGNVLQVDEQEKGFEPLFDGVSLTGWTPTGNVNAWAVENGELLVKPAGGGWLRTEKQYRDFDLRLDFFLPPKGNSGVALRASSNENPAFSGMEVQVYDTFGEDPYPGACGAIYDAIAPNEMALNQPNSWNTYRMVLSGDMINVWLNGKHIHKNEKLDGRGTGQAMALQHRLKTGYIALQDHGDPIRYRNIRIKDLSPDPDPGGFRPLVTNDLSNWFEDGNASWVVENGNLVGRDGPGHLFTKKKFGDFEIRAHVKVNKNGNGGLYFRTMPKLSNNDDWPVEYEEPVGYEAEVDNQDAKEFTGAITNQAFPKVKLTEDNSWFDYRIRVEGDHVQTWINGLPMIDMNLALFDEGHIALQSQHAGNEIIWKDLQIRDLTSTESATTQSSSQESSDRSD
ncbi:MAG: DUF1080 domain-containing protein [Phycisphaerales bacterium]|nr:DUF1080 domain-containing protein [Phycisphaerales bacterium]